MFKSYIIQPISVENMWKRANSFSVNLTSFMITFKLRNKSEFILIKFQLQVHHVPHLKDRREAAPCHVGSICAARLVLQPHRTHLCDQILFCLKLCPPPLILYDIISYQLTVKRSFSVLNFVPPLYDIISY